MVLAVIADADGVVGEHAAGGRLGAVVHPASAAVERGLCDAVPVEPQPHADADASGGGGAGPAQQRGAVRSRGSYAASRPVSAVSVYVRFPSSPPPQSPR